MHDIDKSHGVGSPEDSHGSTTVSNLATMLTTFFFFLLFVSFQNFCSDSELSSRFNVSAFQILFSVISISSFESDIIIYYRIAVQSFQI